MLNKYSFLVLLVLSFACGKAYQTNALFAASVSRITVEGNTRIDTQTILSYFSVKKGATISEDELNKALENLFQTGFFADVIARQKGDTLILTVVENNIINQVAFDGNKAVEDKLLNQELGLRPREVYTPARVQEAAQKIRDIYRLKGYVGAQVEPKLIKRDQGRVDVVFEIQEGKPARVSRISFVGNKRFSDSQLRSVILTKTSAWWRIFSSDDSYEPDRLAYDQELLRQHYLKSGYIDFNILSTAAELSPDQQEFFITFHLVEGERYTFQKIEVVSELPNVDVQALKKEVTFAEGDWFNNLKIESSTDRLLTALEEKGFYFVDILPDLTQDTEKKTVALTFKIVKKPPVYTNQIIIQGNKVTDDSVIRREFRFAEGDPLNTTKVARTKQRLTALDFFEKFDVQPETITKDRKNLRVTVEEKQTGALMGAGGYSTADGPLIELKAMERNFRGKGQEVELKGTLARRSRSIFFSFLEPYFLNRHLHAGVDLFTTKTKQDTRGTFKSAYEQSDMGMGLRMGYELGEHWFQRWRYRIERQRISGARSSSPFLQSMIGNSTLSSVGHDFIYNSLDNMIDPSEGYSMGLSNDFVGLGGTVRYLSNTLNMGYYYPLSRENSVVLNIRGKGGYLFKLGKPLRVADRYSLGGAAFRGFGEAGLGPRDRITEDAIGGQKFAVGTVEISFPLGLPKEYDVKGYTFTEWGSLWGSGERSSIYAARIASDGFRMRGSLGIGVRWSSPFGLIGCSFSKVLRKVQGVDQTEVFRFSVGGEF